VIASVNGLPFVVRCLDALGRQEWHGLPPHGGRAEVLVVDRCGEDTRAALRSRFPGVEVIAADGRTALPALRAQGIARARGRLVAVLADRFIPDPGWLAALEEAHRSGREAFGGAVENGSTTRVVDWAVFLCEYAPFVPPLARGPASALPGNNAVYDRALLARIEGALEGGAWDGFLHEKIRALGVRLWTEPSLRVTHRKEYQFSAFLSQRYHASRAFAATRLAAAPRWKRLAYACATPLLPPLLLARLLAVVARKHRHRERFVVAAPLILTFLVSGAWGEAVGALLGTGDSLERLD
jgi:hypothetical protein